MTQEQLRSEHPAVSSIAAISQNGHHREELLLRLVASGVQLAAALRLDKQALYDEEGVTNAARSIGRILDPLFVAAGCEPLHVLITSYFSECSTAVGNSAAFPSRESPKGMTSRTAQRTLKKLADRLAIQITYRRAATLGRAVDGGAKRVSIQEIPRRLNWYFKLRLRHPLDREDAAQEVMARMTIFGDTCTMKLALAAAHSVTKAFRSIRIQEFSCGDMTKGWTSADARTERMAQLRQMDSIGLRTKIDYVLKSLTYREREIVKLRYGLGDGYTFARSEIARIFKVSAERIRQIELKAIRKLQHPTRAQHLKGFHAEIGA